MRIGPGPVFEAECLTASRRAQFYAARALLVAACWSGSWWSGRSKRDAPAVDTVQGLAEIGRRSTRP